MEQVKVSALYDLRRHAQKQTEVTTPALYLGIGVDVPSATIQGVIRLTPDDARALLTNAHLRQRKLSENRVRQYSRSMQTGDWHEPPETFDSIAFDSNGQLCNGRHRLTALARYDKPLSFFVIIGLQAPVGLPLPDGDQPKPRPKAFVAGIDSHEWATINYLAEHVFGSSLPPWTDVEKLYPLFADAMQAIPRAVSYAPSAPIRAAFVFLWATTDNALERQMLERQWCAYSKLEIAEMWPSMGRLFKKMQTPGKGRTARHWRFAATMYALKHPETTKIYEEPDAGATVKKWIAARLVVQP